MPLLHGYVRQLLAESIIPTGIMARYQVTLNVSLLWSADAMRNHVLLTFHSSGVETILRRNTFSKPGTDLKT